MEDEFCDQQVCLSAQQTQHNLATVRLLDSVWVTSARLVASVAQTLLLTTALEVLTSILLEVKLNNWASADGRIAQMKINLAHAQA